MTPTALLVLAIIDKILALTLEAVKSMPEASKQAYWERHDRQMAFWQGLFERIQPHGDAPQP